MRSPPAGNSAAANYAPIRVLHVTDTFLPKIGGAEIAIDQLVKAMNARGAQCAVLAQKQRAAARPPASPREIDVPYPLRRYSNSRASLWAGWWVKSNLALMEKELGSYDVLIGHHAFPPGYACVKHAVRSGQLVIVYPRGGDIYESSRFRAKPGAWRKLTWTLARANAVICASEAMEKVVRKIIGHSAARNRLIRIPNGVNLQKLTADASASAFAADPQFAAPFVLALGRTIRRKGFHLLIDAFQSLPIEKRPGWKLVIAGEGRELNHLKAQAKSSHKDILFTGLVEGSDKHWLLQHCQFMAAPSLEESFGNVALEAMACGKPVLASRASGFAEIVRDGSNGQLVDVNHPGALAAALAQYFLTSSNEQLIAQGIAARQTADSFSWDNIALRYMDLIERLRATSAKKAPSPRG